MSNLPFTQPIGRRGLLKAGLFAGAGVAAAPLLSACGSTGGPGTAGGPLTWSAWANPGEGERFREFAKQLTKKLGVQVNFQPVVGDYESKLLSQLSAGSAPDVFYVGDGSMSKMIATRQLRDLTDYLDSGKAPVKLSDFHKGLIPWCRPADGSPGLFGLPVDCNPTVFWFNKDVLADAGVTTDPAAHFEAGTWTQDALTDLLDKVRATKKKGLVIGSGWFDWFGFITTFGGTVFDDTGKAVFDTDPKAQDALTWLFEQLKSGNITYGGSLPKGQSVDALFYAGRLATMQYGRWVLPNVKKLKFGYDIAPYPSLSGKDIMPVPVATAALVVNAKAKNRQKALELLGDYVSAEGQTFRLSGGGNAVPSIEGLDRVVTEGHLPAHGKLFNDIAAKGYALPTTLAGNPKLSADFAQLANKLFMARNQTAKSFSGKLVKLLNGAS
ncbi:ABC transporter substrate-binding protein [Streptomyces sp. NPDC048434]|uniref:ABC transporter substrate-binding protein n=1 Tax=Streptomyces sp. NPDC048434 TaxID=3365549 RepID=UPI00371BB252